MSEQLPQHARAVIIGGGIVGCSVAYHLAKLGWRDIVLLERRQLTCGTTWHAAGLIGQLRATLNLTRLAMYSAELFQKLETETGQATGFRQNGSLGIALTSDRLEEFVRAASMAKTFGLEVNVLGSGECRAMHPLLDITGVQGGVFLPRDGQTDPAGVALALAKGARMGGVQIFEHTKVTGILRRDRRVVGVVTERGEISAEVVVNCGGMWGREIGRMAGVHVPLHACEHFYAVTEPIADLPRNLPVLRVPDEATYFKEDAGKVLFGGFELKAKPWGGRGIPEQFSFEQLPEDMDHFSAILEPAVARVPVLATIGIRTFFNGPESFTPDVRFLLGEAPELENFYVACGFNSTGIQSSAGAGKVLAEWIVGGAPPCDLWDVDIRRMAPFQTNRRYLEARVSESLGLLYADHFPYRQYATSRGIRRSAFYRHLAQRGACFGEVAGWERANWFAPPGVAAEYRYGWGRQNWFAYAAAEHAAIRTAVGLLDLSSFAKFRVEGPDAEAVLQLVSAGDVAVAPGRTVYTQWLNPRGGIEADLTVTRLAEDSYLVVTSAASAVRDLAWLRCHIPAEARCTVFDATSGEAVLGVMGPRARDLLGKLSDADLSNRAFPFGAVQPIDIGPVMARAHRISYVGELGWELYFPTEMAEAGFEAIIAAAPEIKLCGMHAVDSCRMEKAYRSFGHDITDEDHVVEAGLRFAVALDKRPSRFGPFVGREAVLHRLEVGTSRRLLQFRLADPEPLLYGNEPVWRDGAIVGRLTSGNYGHFLGAAIGLGYVSMQSGESLADIADASYEIEIAGRRIPAWASVRAMHDPGNVRLHA